MRIVTRDGTIVRTGGNLDIARHALHITHYDFLKASISLLIL